MSTVCDASGSDQTGRQNHLPTSTPSRAPRNARCWEILGFRVHYGAPQSWCLIRWVGKDASGDTWEPVENLTHCEEAVEDLEAARGVMDDRVRSRGLGSLEDSASVGHTARPAGPAGNQPGTGRPNQGLTVTVTTS